MLKPFYTQSFLSIATAVKHNYGDKGFSRLYAKLEFYVEQNLLFMQSCRENANSSIGVVREVNLIALCIYLEIRVVTLNLVPGPEEL